MDSKVFVKAILENPLLSSNIKGHLNVFHMENRRSQQSFVQETLDSKMSYSGCCAYINGTRGNFRILVPHTTLKVSMETRDRWVKELNYLFNMNIVKNSRETCKKLIEQGMIPAEYFTISPININEVIEVMWRKYIESVRNNFLDYKNFVLSNLQQIVAYTNPHLYVNHKYVKTLSLEEVSEYIKNMELVEDLEEMTHKKIKSNKYSSNVLGNFTNILGIISKKLGMNIINYMGAIQNATMSTFFNPYGLILDSSQTSSWFTFKSKEKNTEVVFFMVKNVSLSDTHLYYSNYKQGLSCSYFTTFIPGIPTEAVKNLSHNVAKELFTSENHKLLNSFEYDVSSGALYTLRMINKYKLIPHTLMRALWTPKKDMIDDSVHFIDKYFYFRDKYPELDPYYILNVVGNGYFASSYGTHSSTDYHLYLVPKMPIDELVKKVNFKNRPKLASIVREFYTSANKIEGAITITNTVTKQKTGEGVEKYVERLIQMALKHYD